MAAQQRALQAAIKGMESAGMEATSPAVAALTASLQLLEQDMGNLRAQRKAALPTPVLADRAVRARDEQMAKTKRTAQMLTKTDELILKLQARKLELTKQLGEQQAKSDRLAAEASVLAAKVAAEAMSSPPQQLPPPPPVAVDSHVAQELPADEADPLQAELDALDVFMSTEGTESGLGVSRKPSGDSLLPAPKLARRDGAAPPTSPTAAGHDGR
jgi:outer membrane murein-binding lipoprotein Lpp